MRKMNHIHHFIFMYVFCIINMNVDIAKGQVRFKPPKLAISIGTSYDSNPFRVAEISDTNRIETPASYFACKLAWWTYWNKRVKSYLSTSVNYFYLFKSSFGTEWDARVKLKTIFVLKKRPQQFIPGIDWYIQGQTLKADKIYTNRSEGAEYIVSMKGTESDQLTLGDLFDRVSYSFQSGLEFEFNKWADLEVYYELERNNYKDIGTLATENFYSLDNIEHAVVAAMKFTPSRSFAIKLLYTGYDRTYEHKIAKDLEENDIPDIKRHYWINQYDMKVYLDFIRLKGRITVGLCKRIDLCEGYYDYLKKEIDCNFEYRLSSRLHFVFSYEYAKKDYDHLTLSGNILSNQYDTLEIGCRLFISPNLSIFSSYIYNKEISNYNKFTYKRHLILAQIEYNNF